MSLSRFILLLLQSIIDLLVRSCESYEHGSNLDSDGVPLDDEWENQTFLLPILRDAVAQIKYGFNKKTDYEK